MRFTHERRVPIPVGLGSALLPQLDIIMSGCILMTFKLL
jgi:hypothetical protein